jgi:N-acetylneuraminic acid mutarotase
MKISRNVLLHGLLAVAIVSSFVSCGGKDETEDLIGNWIELNDFKGDARNEAVAFSIDNIGYVGTGYNGTERLKDFFAYDAVTGNWDQISTPPEEFAARISAVAFSANGKGYVGTGRDNISDLSDFWEYDPDENSWTEVASIPVARYAAVAFSINDKGYVGTGYNGSALLDFYEYDPALNSWSIMANYPTKVREAVAFVLDNKGYICTGEKNGSKINDFYVYDPAADKWSPLRKISDVSDESYDDDYTIMREKAVAFTIGGRAYVTTGYLSGLVLDVWEYDPATDSWEAKSGFEGSSRMNAVAFSTADGKAFVTTGANGTSAYFDDIYEFKPLDDYNEDD